MNDMKREENIGEKKLILLAAATFANNPTPGSFTHVACVEDNKSRHQLIL